MIWALVAWTAIIALWVIAMRYLDTRDVTEIRIGSPMGRTKSFKGQDVPEEIIEAWREEKV